MSSSSSMTAKQWLQRRKEQALKRQQGQHPVPGSKPKAVEKVPPFFL